MYFINVLQMVGLEDMYTAPNELSQADGGKRRGACRFSAPERRDTGVGGVSIWPRAVGAAFVDRHRRASYSRQSATISRELIPRSTLLKPVDA